MLRTSGKIPPLLGAALCLGLPLGAQNINSTITGRVEDPQGKRVPDAQVILRDVAKGLERRLITDAEGGFHGAGLLPGVYRVEVIKEAFEPFQSEPFPAQVGETVKLELRLQVAGLETRVDVVAQAPRSLPLDDAKQSRSFGSQEMNDLPVQAGGQGRNFYAQALTSPGVAYSPLAHRPFAVSGQRPRNNNYLVDSAEMNDANSGFIAGRGVTEQLISQEAVQSFEIITHNFKAEFGRNSGSIVSLVSKSGGNALHGSLFEFHNNSALSARNVFETTKASRRSNLAGFTLGGPVKKNKAYFFANYEVFRPRGSQLTTYATLTDAERARAVPSVKPLVDLYPRSPSGSRVLVVGEPRTVNQNTYLLRGDISVTSKQTLMLRTNYTDGVTDSTGIGNTVASRVSINNQTRSAAAHHSYVITPGVLNELRLGYTRQTESDTFLDTPFLGDPKVNGEVGFLIVPGLSPGGFLGFLGRSNLQNNYQLSDDATWIRGRHHVKTGSALRRVHVNGGAITSGFRGQLFFPNVEAFLAGQPLSYNRNIGNPMIALRRWEWHSYVQDDWKVTPRLTLNLGVRYERNTAPTEAADRILPQFRFAGDGNNFAPRFGFAWNPESKTVIRGGYGIFYNAVEMAFLGLTRFNPPLLDNISAFRPQLPDLMARAGSGIQTGLVIPDANTRTPYAQHITLAVERELWNPGSTVGIAYVSTLGRKISRARRPNGGDNLAQPQRPDPTVGVINRLETSGSSSYHGLQASWSQRASRGFLIRAAYTYSKFIDDVSEIPTSNQRLDRNLIPLDEDNLRLDRAVSDFQMPHIFSVSWIYTLQWMRTNRVLGGWTFAGITTMQSGRPYTLYSGTNNLTGTDNNRLHHVPGSLIRVPSSSRPIRLGEGITKAQLTPGQGVLGSLGRNTERSDSLMQWNLSVSKDVSLTEGMRLQLRGELFNIFNTANLDQVDSVLSSPNFGRALTAFDPRGAQIALRFVF